MLSPVHFHCRRMQFSVTETSQKCQWQSYSQSMRPSSLTLVQNIVKNHVVKIFGYKTLQCLRVVTYWLTIFAELDAGNNSVLMLVNIWNSTKAMSCHKYAQPVWKNQIPYFHCNHLCSWELRICFYYSKSVCLSD